MKTVLNVKVDRDVKLKAQRIAADLGLPLSLVVNENLRRFTSERAITFATPLRPRKRLQRAIQEAERDWNAGRNISPAFDSAEAMDSYLGAL